MSSTHLGKDAGKKLAVTSAYAKKGGGESLLAQETSLSYSTVSFECNVTSYLFSLTKDRGLSALIDATLISCPLTNFAIINTRGCGLDFHQKSWVQVP